MRVLIINTAERIGGAAIAANRLMEALKNNGIKAKMLVRNKQTDQVTVVALKKSWRRIWQSHGNELSSGQPTASNGITFLRWILPTRVQILPPYRSSVRQM